METLIAVLLYIGAISTDVEYTQTQIQSIEAQHQNTVNQVEANPTQLDLADDVWDTSIMVQTGDKIIVVDDPMF
ncbi:MAG: hypothetical protein JXQ87_15210 [Bacteroidia bacterium]